MRIISVAQAVWARTIGQSRLHIQSRTHIRDDPSGRIVSCTTGVGITWRSRGVASERSAIGALVIKHPVRAANILVVWRAVQSGALRDEVAPRSGSTDIFISIVRIGARSGGARHTNGVDRHVPARDALRAMPSADGRGE